MTALVDALKRHVAWQDVQGRLSQDQYDLWATHLGGRVKRSYYEGSRCGKLAGSGLVVLDAVVPPVRKLLRPPAAFPTADAHYVMGHHALGACVEGHNASERSAILLAALGRERSPGFDEYCWGYPFDWVSVSGTWAAGTPLITVTPYAYEAFEAYYEATCDTDSLEVMRSIAEWASQCLPQTDISPGVQASAYTPFDTRRVINASAYRGHLLLTAGRRFERPDWIAAGDANLSFVLSVQRQDGSWLYAADGRDAFIDNIHTCFVLKNLAKSIEKTERCELGDALVSGYAFYKSALLDGSALPKPFAVTQRPSLVRRELYDFAEGINLALLMLDHDRDAEAILLLLIEELLRRWQLPDGHFVTRTTLLGSNTVPYHRWGQSQAFRALALAAAKGWPAV